MKESFRNRFSKWFDIITYGNKPKYIRFIIWLFIDSFVASIPSGVLMVVIYLLLAPIMTDTAVYEQKPLWLLAGILLVQTLLYALVRKKTYLDICVGHSEAQQNEKIRFGDKLKALPMGFFATHDAGSISTLLVRDYEEIETLSSSMVSNITVIGLRLLMALIVMSVFNIKMALAMFAVIPLAIPFAVISYKQLTVSSGDLLKIQQDTASTVLEYTGGISTLQDAEDFINLGAERLGTSRIVKLAMAQEG